MKIYIYNRELASITVEIDTPYEMRALYVLLHLISHEEFKIVKQGMGNFDGLPGLGKYCIEDIAQNPVKRLYLLLRGKEGQQPSSSDVSAIILACKKAIHNYNNKLLEFFYSDLMTPSSELHIPTSIMMKATSRNRPLTEEEFMGDSHVKWSHVNEPANRLRMFDLYQRYQRLISGFSPIDVNRAVNITGLVGMFKTLCEKIAVDEYIHNDDVRVAGIDYAWHEWHIQPSMFGSLSSIGVGVSVAVAKSAYDVILKPAIEANSVLLKIAIDNSINLFSLLSTLLVNRKAVQFKEVRDTKAMNIAVKELADKVHEYKHLLIEKGFLYSANEITLVDAPAAPLLLSDDDSDLNPEDSFEYILQHSH